MFERTEEQQQFRKENCQRKRIKKSFATKKEKIKTDKNDRGFPPELQKGPFHICPLNTLAFFQFG